MCSINSSFLIAVIAGLVVLGTESARAQSSEDSVPADRLRPPLDRDGLIGVESAFIPGHLATSAVAWLGHGVSPVTSSDDELVSGRVGGGVGLALGLGRRVELGLDLPLVLYQWRETEPRNAGPLDTSGVGDLRFALKFGLPTWQRPCIRLAGLVAATLPSGGGGGYLGEQDKSLALELLGTHVHGRRRIAVNVGYHLRPPSEADDLVVDDEVVVRGGAAWRFPTIVGRSIDLQASLALRLAPDAPFQNDRTGLEVLGAAALELARPIDLFAASGFGLTDGAGTPDWRVLAGLRYGLQLDVSHPASATRLASAPER